MNDLKEKVPSIRHCFVDEAGEPTLFNDKGKVIVVTEDYSRFFMQPNLYERNGLKNLRWENVSSPHSPSNETPSLDSYD